MSHARTYDTNIIFKKKDLHEMLIFAITILKITPVISIESSKRFFLLFLLNDFNLKQWLSLCLHSLFLI